MQRHQNKITSDLESCHLCGSEVFISCDGLTAIFCNGCPMTFSNSQRSIVKLRSEWNNRSRSEGIEGEFPVNDNKKDEN